MGWINYDVWKALNGGDAPVTTYYALLSSSYDSAVFTAVTMANTDIISFSIKGLTGGSVSYILTDAGSAYLYYRGSDGRMRMRLNDGILLTFNNITEINDGLQHYLEIRLSPSNAELWVDGALRATANASIGDVSFDAIASDMPVGAVYGVTLGNQASWGMLSTDYSLDSADLIGANDLTYVNAPVTPVESDFVEVAL